MLVGVPHEAFVFVDVKNINRNFSSHVHPVFVVATIP